MDPRTIDSRHFYITIKVTRMYLRQCNIFLASFSRKLWVILIYYTHGELKYIGSWVFFCYFRYAITKLFVCFWLIKHDSLDTQRTIFFLDRLSCFDFWCPMFTNRFLGFHHILWIIAHSFQMFWGPRTIKFYTLLYYYQGHKVVPRPRI